MTMMLLVAGTFIVLLLSITPVLSIFTLLAVSAPVASAAATPVGLVVVA